MTKYLITGGCGFIGSHLADFLIKQGFAVRIFDDLSSGKQENAPSEAEVFIGSITDKKLVEQIIEGVDGIFHLAAIASVQKAIENWSLVHEVNSCGSIYLFETLARLKKPLPLIYASSASIYGTASTSEHLQPKPLSAYGIDKLATEWHAHFLWNFFHIPVICFRFFNVFGPRQDPSSPYSGVISIFLEKILNEMPLTIFGDGKQMRDFVYVKDVARILTHTMLQLKKGAETYNLCTGIGTSVDELATLIAQITDKSITKNYLPPRKGEIRFSIGNPMKLKNQLGITTQYTLEQGLKEMVGLCVS